MVTINIAKREISVKLVYYGPGLSGKTTNLEFIHKKAPSGKTGELTTIATESDRTLFFDYMPLRLGKIGGLTTKFQLYTVPGQAYYNATRRLVLQGADGVVFVADSQRDKVAENLESFKNLAKNLEEYGMNIAEMPLVLQWNKRDLPQALSPDELSLLLNKYNSPCFPAVAVTGEGVFQTLKELAKIVLNKLHDQEGMTPITAPESSPVRPPVPVPPPAPVPSLAPVAAPTLTPAPSISPTISKTSPPSPSLGPRVKTAFKTEPSEAISISGDAAQSRRASGQYLLAFLSVLAVTSLAFAKLGGLF